MWLKAFTKKSFPKYKRGQEDKAKKTFRKIYKEIIPSRGDLKLIFDNESYFFVDPVLSGGKKFYHVENPAFVFIEVRMVLTERFLEKVMVLQAIDEGWNNSDPVVF